MTILTNEKLAGLEPRWASYPGFSWLFDNPGNSLAPFGSDLCVHCEVDTDAELILYRAFRDGMRKIGGDSLIGQYLLCPLPPASYHVTVCDGVNAGNVSQVVAAHRATWERILRSLPQSLGELNRLPLIAAPSPLANANWGIQFRFERLENWSSISLVARLAAADEASAAALGRLADARTGWLQSFGREFGLRPEPILTPHVTLGYFGNRELAQGAYPLLEAWNSLFREQTVGLTLRFRQVSLYGFTDMATFFKIAL